MARLKHKLSEPPVPPARGVKAATFRLLLDTAMDIIQKPRSFFHARAGHQDRAAGDRL